MKFLFLFFLILFPILGHAQSVGPEDVGPLLEQMKMKGEISEEEFKTTQQYMKSMDTQKWSELEKKAKDCLQRSPAQTENSLNENQLCP